MNPQALQAVRGSAAQRAGCGGRRAKRAGRPALWFALALAAVLGTGCVSFTYRPAVTLGLSPQQIPVRVEMQDLQDGTPPGDRTRPFGGTSATASDTLSGELSTAVTDSLLESFRNDELFTEIRRRPEQPDLLLGGTLRRFYGKSNMNPLGWVAVLYSPVIFLGIPIYTSRGAVELELVFKRPDGSEVARYAAARTFKEYGSIYRSPLFGIGTRLNRAYTEAMREIRERILADRELLAARSVEIRAAPQDPPDPGAGTAPPPADPPSPAPQLR